LEREKRRERNAQKTRAPFSHHSIFHSLLSSLATPWPELAAFASSLDLPSLDDVTHRHVPAAVLVIRACEAVGADKAAAAGSQQAGPPAPLSSSDLPAVRAKLASWRRPAGHGGAALHADEENFDEAADFARRALAPPDAIRELTEKRESWVF